MSSDRKIAIIVGVLYIAATVGGVLSVAFSGPLLEKPINLISITAGENQVKIVAYLEIIMAVTVAGIAFMFYPILRQDADTECKKGLTLWYVGTRITESALFFVGVLSVLLLLKLSQEFVKTGEMDATWFATAGALLLTASEYSWMLGQSIFCIGAAILYWLLYKSKRVPQWLSVWGFIAAPLMFIAGFLPLYGINSNSTLYALLCAPMGLQEMVLALWLIIKGFTSSTLDSSKGI